MGTYWAKLTQSKISRRHALRVGGGLGAGMAALGLVGCGSDGVGNKSSGASSLVGKPVDTTSKARRGGTLVMLEEADTASFDPVLNISSSARRVEGIYSRLVRNVVGKYPKVADGSVEGDAATSWELSPDQTQVTLKLRPGVKYDARPPTNGRAMTAADVKFTWERQAARYTGRTDLVNSLSPEAPFLGVETPDDNTVVFKMAYPYPPAVELLAWAPYFLIVPREIEGGFEGRSVARGSGPWMQDAHEPSIRMQFRRNPEWWDAKSGRPYLDGYSVIFMEQYATRSSQFRAGELWAFDTVRPEDLLPLKRDLPQLNLIQQPAFARGSILILVGGLIRGSPWMDERVRQAASMLIDRDLWAKTFLNLDQFEAEGLDVPTRWGTHVPPGEESWWLNPRDGKAFGPNAKYYQHNPEEARKLLSAATGGKLPVEDEYLYTTNNGGSVYLNSAEVLRQMLEENRNFKLKPVGTDYTSHFRPQINDGHGDWQGIAQTNGSNKANVDLFLYSNIHSKGSKTKLPFGEPTVDDLILKQRQETDLSKRIALVHQLQQYMAGKMYSIPYNVVAQGFTISWPWLGNYQVYSAWSEPKAEVFPFYWYDDSKKT